MSNVVLCNRSEEIFVKHQIWIEGYLATGMEGIPAPAKLLGTVEEETFTEACDKLRPSGRSNTETMTARVAPCGAAVYSTTKQTPAVALADCVA